MDKDKREEHFYYNEKGLLVFTRDYHLKRGYCCGCACLHCPYEHANVFKTNEVNDGRETESLS